MPPLPHAEPVPDSLLAAIDAVGKARLGAADRTGAALARAVAQVSEGYTRERGRLSELVSGREALSARLRFFLPRDAPKIVAPLAELAAVTALPRPSELRVLDLGAGLGATSLGAARFLLSQPGVSRLHIDAVDADATALALGSALAERYAQLADLPLRWHARAERLGPALLKKLDRGYDLILLGFVLNELALDASDPAAAHVAWLSQLIPLLGEGGAIVVLEPALREQSRALQRARTTIAQSNGPAHVFAPCLHAGACPLLARERDWCHERLQAELPAALQPIARMAGLRDEDLSFSYLTVRADQRSLAELSVSDTAPALRGGGLGELGALYRVVSGSLGSKGKLELSVCGAGPHTRLRRLDRHAHPSNAQLESAGRGTLLYVQGAADTGDGVLRVTPETAVARLPRG